ncbi:MAG: glutaredoxin family protein [Bacteroidota bacterium]
MHLRAYTHQVDSRIEKEIRMEDKQVKEIKLYGAAHCHKTRYYQELLREKGLDFAFLDVEENEAAADELRALYTTGRLNFPTLLIDGKKLRNPSLLDLEKWLSKKGYTSA